VSETDEVKKIPLEDIYWTDETDITKEQIHDMAMSFVTHGQIEPIIVTPDGKGKYRGVCGRLRYEAMKYRWRNDPKGKTILARIHHFEDEAEIKAWQLAENLHRRELPAMQKARLYRELYDLMKQKEEDEVTMELLAVDMEKLTGEEVSAKTIQHYISLTKLQPEVQEILTREKWPLRWGLELARIKDPKKQVEAAKKIVSDQEEYDSLVDVKWYVDGILSEERRKKRNEQLN